MNCFNILTCWFSHFCQVLVVWIDFFPSSLRIVFQLLCIPGNFWCHDDARHYELSAGYVCIPIKIPELYSRMQLFGNGSFQVNQDLLGRTRAVVSVGVIIPHHWRCVLHPSPMNHVSQPHWWELALFPAPCPCLLDGFPPWLGSHLTCVCCQNSAETCKVGVGRCSAYFLSSFSVQLSLVPQLWLP